MKSILVFIVSATSALAASEGGHHGSAADLIAPFVNVAILSIFLIWKLKNPLSNYFVKKSTDVSEIMSRASIKAKEAEMLFKMQQSKLEKLDDEIQKIDSEAKTQVKEFEQEYKKGVDDRIQKLKEDAGLKIESEKNEMIEKVNSMLLDEVLTRTKTAIKNDQSLGQRVSENLIQG